MAKLTKKQKGFVKDYIETENATEAAERNYDVKDRDVARSIGSENLAKPDIYNSIQEALPDELLAKVHLEGLKAGKTIFKNNVSSGEVEEVGYEPDYAVRHKYLDSAYKLKGSYQNGEETNKTLIINITGETAERYGLIAAQKPE